MTLAVQDFLRQYSPGRGRECLEKDFCIKVTAHPQHTNLVLLKYDIGAPMGQQIVRECRGLILDRKRDWQAVCMAMTKFFNAGEHWADPIDWDTARVQEKLDGSLVCLWWYDGWRVSTSGHPAAGGPVMQLGITFEQLFWQAWEKEGYALPGAKNYTYFFELTSPQNRHVVRYTELCLTLLGVRNMATLCEEDPGAWADLLGYKIPRQYNLADLEEIKATFPDLNPIDQEGYVVCDEAFRRLKVKSPAYVALHHAKDQCSDRKFLDLIRSGESTEFLAYFPEYQEQFNKIRGGYEEAISALEAAWEQNKTASSQKEFAEAVKHLPLSGALFALRAGKVKSAREFLAKAPLPSLERQILK